MIQTKHVQCLAITVLMGAAGVAFAQAKAGAAVKASGCVEAGVEAGCLIVNSAADKKTYNLLVGKGPKPAIGTAISFEGTAFSGATTCMQGTPVTVTKWTKADMACPKGANK